MTSVAKIAILGAILVVLAFAVGQLRRHDQGFPPEARLNGTPGGSAQPTSPREYQRPTVLQPRRAGSINSFQPGRNPSRVPASEYPASEYPASEYPASEYPASEYPASEYPASTTSPSGVPVPGVPASAGISQPSAGQYGLNANSPAIPREPNSLPDANATNDLRSTGHQLAIPSPFQMDQFEARMASTVPRPVEPPPLESPVARPDHLRSDLSEEIPSPYDVTPIAVAPQMQPPRKPERPTRVTTVDQDSFWNISMRVYGVGDYYKALYFHNRSRVHRPDALEVGIPISTPSLDELQRLYPNQCPETTLRSARSGA